MDFIKIPLCACTLDRCKKKTPVIGDHFNQSVQTDICFNKNKAFSNIEVGDGEIYDKHSISSSVQAQQSKTIQDSESKGSLSHKDSLLEPDYEESKDRDLYILAEEEDAAKEVESTEDIQILPTIVSEEEAEESTLHDYASAGLISSVGEMIPSESFEQAKVKGSIRSIGSQSTTASKSGRQIYQPKVPRKKLTPSKREPSRGLKFRKLPGILIERNDRCNNWPLSVEPWCCKENASSDCMWSRIPASACSSTYQSCRMSHSMQCASQNCTTGLYRTECRQDMQNFFQDIRSRVNNVNCYKVLQSPHCPAQVCQNSNVYAKSSDPCNIHGIRVCRPPQLQPQRECQDCRAHRAQIKHCIENKQFYRKSLAYACTNMHCKNYCGRNNLYAMFTPPKMYCTYRHTVLQPSTNIQSLPVTVTF